jgi:hypothetical protein
VGGVQTTLVSRVLGQTAALRQSKSVAREKRQWDETSFLARLTEVCDASDVEVMRELLSWSGERFTSLAWGGGELDGSVRPVLNVDGVDHSAFALATWAGGVIQVQFHHLAYRARFEDERVRDDLRSRLNAIEGVDIASDTLRRRPSFSIRLLRDTQQRQLFYDAVEWFLDTARSARAGTTS